RLDTEHPSAASTALAGGSPRRRISRVGDVLDRSVVRRLAPMADQERAARRARQQHVGLREGLVGVLAGRRVIRAALVANQGLFAIGTVDHGYLSGGNHHEGRRDRTRSAERLPYYGTAGVERRHRPIWRTAC